MKGVWKMNPTCCGHLVRSHGDPMDKWNTPEALRQEFLGTSGEVFDGWFARQTIMVPGHHYRTRSLQARPSWVLNHREACQV